MEYRRMLSIPGFLPLKYIKAANKDLLSIRPAFMAATASGNLVVDSTDVSFAPIPFGAR